MTTSLDQKSNGKLLMEGKLWKSNRVSLDFGELVLLFFLKPVTPGCCFLVFFVAPDLPTSAMFTVSCVIQPKKPAINTF